LNYGLIVSLGGSTDAPKNNFSCYLSFNFAGVRFVLLLSHQSDVIQISDRRWAAHANFTWFPACGISAGVDRGISRHCGGAE
jgi:hypothetical protein